jgi:cytochrome P450
LKQASLFKRVKAASGNPFELLPAAAYEQSLYHYDMPMAKLVMVNDPAGVKQVLLDNVENYPRTEFEILIFSALFGDGLFTAPPAKWRMHRRVMAPAFGAKAVTSYAPVMVDAAEEFSRQWQDRAGGELDIAEEMKALTLTVICRTMFSSDADELKALAGPALDFAMAQLAFGFLDILPVIGPMRIRQRSNAIHRCFHGMDETIYRLIAARESNREHAPNDLLSRLIDATDGDARFTPQEVRDEVITIFMAGHETTAVTLTWLWYLLSLHPEVEARLHAELDQVLGGRSPNVDDLERLPYLRMVLEEAMRLYPPAPGLSVRRAIKDDVILGEPIAAGTQVGLAPWVMHRHKKLWADPLRFDPERFAPEQSERRPRFAYMPFGGGPRVCIGAMLATMESSLLLAVMAQQYRLELIPGQDVKLQARVTLRPQDPLRMRLVRRRS